MLRVYVEFGTSIRHSSRDVKSAVGYARRGSGREIQVEDRT